MKRLLIILIISSVFSDLLPAATNQKEFSSPSGFNSSMAASPDSTITKSPLVIDSFRLTLLKPSAGVQFYRDGIVFLSLSKYEEKLPPTFISFGTMETYYAVPKDSILGKHIIFSPLTSFSYPSDGISFSPDFKTMYFTKIPKKGTREQIYMAKFSLAGKDKGGWISDKNPLSFCLGNYTYSHPAISADGKIMIFASDKEDSLGGMDLFITRKEGDKWASPQNLGKLINSRGNEFFPFLDSENNLFFSSDGLPGFGGFDIFISRFNGKVWDRPMNLSDRINTENDDIAFTINKTDGKTAFLTRRDKLHKEVTQLFRLSINKELSGSELLTISNVFLDNSLLNKFLTTSKSLISPKPAIAVQAKVNQKNVSAKNNSAAGTAITKRQPKEVTRESIVVNPVASSTLPEIKLRRDRKMALRLIPFVSRQVAVAVITSPVASVASDPPPPVTRTNNEVIFRIQVASSKTAKKNFQFTANNITYNTFEYFYMKEYRYTIGEFSTPKAAIELQNAIRKGGISQVFVVAFKNNVRSLDPALFK